MVQIDDITLGVWLQKIKDIYFLLVNLKNCREINMWMATKTRRKNYSVVTSSTEYHDGTSD